jgi:hypothetical protein
MRVHSALKSRFKRSTLPPPRPHSAPPVRAKSPWRGTAAPAQSPARVPSLAADGLYRGKKLVASKTEEDIYEALDLQFIEPELREGRDELTKAAKHSLPKLVGDKDLHGILHCHTTASDGTETLETMAEATRERGFEYFGVADHSQSAHYAGGLSLEEIAEQHREADRLNKRYGKSFLILKVIEADILGDGSLDYLNSVLSTPTRTRGPAATDDATTEAAMTVLPLPVGEVSSADLTPPATRRSKSSMISL